MFSSPDPDILLDDLGDKFLSALVRSVSAARSDLDEMQAWRPGWFPNMHGRCLANLIHDRIWSHMVTAVVDDSEVTVIERGATRELQVGLNFLLRVKRHHEDDGISTYPTAAALLFYEQSSEPTFDGMEVITLAVGYRWDSELRHIGAAVVSYRAGKDNPIWSVELDEPEDGTTAITWKPLTGPDLPEVQFGDETEEEDGGATGTDGQE